MAQKFYTSKFGTKIDVTGLDAKTLAEVKRLADSRYGTKAAELAKSYQTKNKPKTSTPAAPAAQPAASTLPDTDRSVTVSGANLANPNQAAEVDTKLKENIANVDTLRSNPNLINDFGSSTVTYGPDGQPTVTSRLTGTNKELIEGQQKSGSLGAQVAGNLISNVGSYDPNSVDQKYGIPQVNDQYMQRYQDAAYQSLTRNLEKRYQQEKEQKAQELVNRGIPQGSPQFQAEMNRDIEDRYNEQRSAAENQAYSAGLGAGQANFGMGLQANQAANQNYNTSFGNRVAWGGQLNNMAQGQAAPSQQFQAAQTQGTDVAGIHATTVGANLSREQIAAQERIAAQNRARANSGGGNNTNNQPAIDL